MNITRRNFLKASLCSGLVLYSPQLMANRLYASPSPLKKASFFHQSADGRVVCDLCHHACEIAPERVGICQSRINKNGDLYTLTYGRPVAIHLDPIGKMPMRHVLPGCRTLSVGTAGCTFSCLYCINSQFTQKNPSEVEFISQTPEALVAIALRKHIPAIAFSYNEPTVAYEYMFETFALAKQKGLKTFFHTNGYMKPTPLRMLLSVTDGVVVDLKAFSKDTYRQLTNGNLSPIQETLQIINQEGHFVEVVTLLVPGYNDSEEEIESISRFIGKNLSENVPLHFSRFFPRYRLSHLPPTPSESVSAAVAIARRNNLHFVYANNITLPGNDTYCPKCGKAIVMLQGIRNPKLSIEDGHCSFCGQIIPGIWTA